jgi:hypothetical protein
MQQHLWAHGTDATRAALAARSDLDPSLQSLAAASDDERILRSWLGVPARRRSLLALACRPDLPEACLALLASQRNLGPAGVDWLVQRDTEQVAALLLLRPDLTAAQRRAATATYAARTVHVGWSQAEALRRHIGNDAAAWSVALSVAPRGSSAVPLAATAAASFDAAVQEAVVAWCEQYPTSHSYDSMRDQAQAVGRLLSEPGLPPELAQRISALPANSALSHDAGRIAALDVPGLVEKAAAGDLGASTLPGLAAASAAGVHLPMLKVLGGCYLSQVPSGPGDSEALTTLVRYASAIDVGAALDGLISEGKPDQARDLLARAVSLTSLEAMENPGPLVELLSREGNAELLRTALATSHAGLIAGTFSPLAAALWVPAVAGAVIAGIEERFSLDEPALDTALSLLGEWQGTLPALLNAAAALANRR